MSGPKLPNSLAGTAISSLALLPSAEDLKTEAEKAVWERRDYGIAIHSLRRLLSHTEYASACDKRRKHMARTIWRCIIDDLMGSSREILNGKPRSPVRGHARSLSWRQVLGESLRREQRDRRCRGLATQTFDAIDIELAELFARGFAIARIDYEMDLILDEEGPPLTDDMLSQVQDWLS
jgi:hypothetical protein